MCDKGFGKHAEQVLKRPLGHPRKLKLCLREFQDETRSSKTIGESDNNTSRLAQDAGDPQPWQSVGRGKMPQALLLILLGRGSINPTGAAVMVVVPIRCTSYSEKAT
eukprot:5766-Pyramimonas_sp.AAC.1